jgi:putative phosphoesterase
MIQHFELADGAEALRVAIVSDTHAWLHPAIADFVQGCDIAVHAGDICGAAILADLRPRLGRVIAVAGNNDVPKLWADSERDIVSALPRRAHIRLPGGVLAVEHGEDHGFQHPDHAALREAHPNARLIVYGHTHKRVLDDGSAPWVLNPGAAGRTRTHGGPSCAVLEAAADAWRVELRVFDRVSVVSG